MWKPALGAHVGGAGGSYGQGGGLTKSGTHVPQFSPLRFGQLGTRYTARRVLQAGQGGSGGVLTLAAGEADDLRKCNTV